MGLGFGLVVVGMEIIGWMVYRISRLIKLFRSMNVFSWERVKGRGGGERERREIGVSCVSIFNLNRIKSTI